jgi:uncharacterized protein (DUF1697 family)
MPRYVAFLRAINVGGHVVKMDALRRIFEKAGCAEVETVIASGNVIFSSSSKSEPALAAKLAASLETALGYEVATFLRTPAELAEAARREPFELGDGDRLYVGFLSGKPPAAAVRALRDCATATDDFRVLGRELYWHCRTRFAESLFSGSRLEKTLGMPTTLRNVTTVRKLAAKCSV